MSENHQKCLKTEKMLTKMSEKRENTYKKVEKP